MKNEKLISIVIPIYNGAKYISNIYTNIMNQTYRPIELIFVNDGSKDDSENVLKDIVKMHNCKSEIKIIILSGPNGGIAVARNRGMAASTGEYVMFADQDDWLEKDCVEKLMQVAGLTDADMVIGGFRKVNQKGEILETWSLNPELSWSKYRITAPWGRLFRKSVIEAEQLEFFNTKISEDLYFNILFMSYATKIEVISYVGYNWLQFQNSESHHNWTKMTDERNPIEMLTELHKKMGNHILLKDDELAFFFSKYVVWYLLYCSKGADKLQVRQRTQEVFAWLEKKYPQFYKLIWRGGIFPQGELFKVRLCVVCVLLMYKLNMLSFFLEQYRKL